MTTFVLASASNTDHHPMYLCLSSASREGYSKDVVDTLAAPIGGEHQFRYDRKWVEPSIQALIQKNGLPTNAKCLLCFVDLRGKPQRPVILPLREAILTRVIAVGTTYTLVFQLGAFRRPSDTLAFSDYTLNSLPELHHFHQEPGTMEPTGFLWMDDKGQVEAQLKPPIIDGNWVLEWEGIVCDYVNIMHAPVNFSKEMLDKNALANEDQSFKDESPYYVFYTLKPVGGGDPVRSTTSRGRPAFQLASGASYELSFYQYHPTKSFPEVSLKLAANQPNIEFIGNQERRFDTRYDVKRFTLTTADLLTGSSADILVSRIFDDKTPQISVDDFYLNVDTSGSKAKIILYATAIAAAFAIPQLITVSKATPPTDASTYIVVIVAALVLGFLATIKDVLKLK